ncbi:Hepatic lectin [Dissostichus eleginoides]|uniref:Hepatic lectin n=1 Tax=Dissostichus eleginoides TaxID=100907 RepID=A0AAD9F6H8_DISEL|nr:Hepatic lectin [Dissostichus eleginoides]
MLTKSCSTILIILNLILNLPLIEQTSQQGRRFIHVSDRMTWSSAQEYCREHHTDLATIRDQNDIDAIRSISHPCHRNNRCWIGLLRDTTNQVEWNWYDGDESTLREWKSGQPNDLDGNQDCVSLVTVLEWNDEKCDEQLSFVCYDGYDDDLIFVKENKTWEEALEHCRNLDIDPLQES